jgi:uncharacterized protein (DUF934 family)
MPLVSAGNIVGDIYVHLADDEAVPESVPVIVSAKRFFEQAPVLSNRHAPTGVVWPNNREVAELRPFLESLALIALVFPTFRDGRAYSQARLLRERYDFRGELRATGQVLRDQFLFMVRSGFDAFEVEKPGDAAVFRETLERYSAFYQPTGRHASAKRGFLDIVNDPSRSRSTV